MILFVVNYRSGSGLGQSIWHQVERELHRCGTEYISISADSQQEALAQAEQAAQQHSLQALVAVGGDGTLHSLLPLACRTNLPLGLIPAGSGNDAARALRIPRDPLQALALILAGRSQAIDLIQSRSDAAHDRLMLTAAAIGIDGAVAEDVNRSRYKRWCNKLNFGSLAYVIGLLRLLVRFKPSDATIELDGHTHRFAKCWISAVTNCASYGGGLRINPQARMDDGVMDLCVVHNCSVWRIILLFPALLLGKHTGMSCVTQLTGREAFIHTSHPCMVCIDGELNGRTPISLELLPAQLRFLGGVSSSG